MSGAIELSGSSIPMSQWTVVGTNGYMRHPHKSWRFCLVPKTDTPREDFHIVHQASHNPVIPAPEIQTKALGCLWHPVLSCSMFWWQVSFELQVFHITVIYTEAEMAVFGMARRHVLMSESVTGLEMNLSSAPPLITIVWSCGGAKQTGPIQPILLRDTLVVGLWWGSHKEFWSSFI